MRRLSGGLRPPRQEDFSSPLRDDRVTARVGLWLGVAFLVAFVTGIFSYLGQSTPGWFTYPTRPASLYRITQGIHVLAGTAAVPLLLVKLWSVYPRLFARLPRSLSRRSLVELVERLSIGVLVASAVFELITGLQNITHWYAWGFSFRPAHYAVAWLVTGSILVHVAVKLPIIRAALGTPVDAPESMPIAGPATAAPDRQAALSRRALLRTTWGAAGLAVVATAGQTVPWLRDVSVFGVRSGDGPQGVPVNRSAVAADVVDRATNSSWALTITYRSQRLRLTRSQLAAMPQRTRSLPISCVEGWSASAVWTGVPMADLLARVGAPARSEVFVTSLERSGPFSTSTLPPQFAADSDTLLALRLNGEPLNIDHGFPCRIIAPARPGVLQTKWVDRLEVAG